MNESWPSLYYSIVRAHSVSRTRAYTIVQVCALSLTQTHAITHQHMLARGSDEALSFFGAVASLKVVVALASSTVRYMYMCVHIYMCITYIYIV